jgi:hypothetical protein
MGAVNTTYTFTATDTITSTKMNNIIDQTTMTSDACLSGGGLQVASGQLSIAPNAINNSRLATDSVTSANIVDGTIVNADINASAAIAGTKIYPDFGNQNIYTNRTASDFNSLYLTNTSGVQVSLNANGNSEGNLRTTTAHPFTLSTSNTERMRITASGNVGIGTSSPNAKLQVAGGVIRVEANGGEGGHIELLSADNNVVSGVLDVDSTNKTRLLSVTNTPVVIGANSEEAIRVVSGGNVGIGTTAPSTKLQVNGIVTATAFSGPLTGNVTGNVTGSASTVSNSAITAAKLDGNQSGSAPIYGARAWVNFSGVGTVGSNMTIRASGNVSSVNKLGTGRYRVTFATPMDDANYAAIVGGDANAPHKIPGVITQNASYVDIGYSQINTSTARDDPDWGSVVIMR